MLTAASAQLSQEEHGGLDWPSSGGAGLAGGTASESDLIGTARAPCLLCIRRHLVSLGSQTLVRILPLLGRDRHRQTEKSGSERLGKQPSGHVIESRIMLSWD